MKPICFHAEMLRQIAMSDKCFNEKFIQNGRVVDSRKVSRPLFMLLRLEIN